MLQAAKYIGSGLATIGLTKQILQPVLSSNTLCPSVISHLGEQAITTVDVMLRSLSEDSLVLKHIVEIASGVELCTTAVVKDGLIVPNQAVSFREGNVTSKSPSGTGVYVFTERVPAQGSSVCRQAVGSALSFTTRLTQHLDAFAGVINRTPLHVYGATLSGADSFLFGPIYYLPNYLDTFYSRYPNYTLSQGEYDILMAVSQLVPRLLEQSIMYHFPCSLNGGLQLVTFRYTSFNPALFSTPLILGFNGIPVNVISDGVVVFTSQSKHQLMPKLGIGSRRTIDRYMNHIKPINSPLIGPVNLQEVNYTLPLLTHELIHRADFELLLPDLMIPGLDSPYDLAMGPVYVYTEDKLLYGTYDSIALAAKALNPSQIKPRGREIKISRLMGLDSLVTNELGCFYFNEHPDVDRFSLSQAGNYPCLLYDLELGTCTSFVGLKPLVRYLA
jgi:hypothetical protein